jgi:hypothetical protein
METLSIVVISLAMASVVVLAQAALAPRRWQTVVVHGAPIGAGAYREAPVVRTRRRWRAPSGGVTAASMLAVLWALATGAFALAGMLLPPVWPVSLSGFVLVVLLFHAAALLATRGEGRVERVRHITTYSYVHHAAVVGTFALMSVWSAFAGRAEMVALLVFTVVACTVGVGITALVRSAASAERDDDA